MIRLTTEQVQQIEDVLWTLEQHNKLYYGETHNTVIEANKALSTIRAARANFQSETSIENNPADSFKANYPVAWIIPCRNSR